MPISDLLRLCLLKATQIFTLFFYKLYESDAVGIDQYFIICLHFLAIEVILLIFLTCLLFNTGILNMPLLIIFIAKKSRKIHSFVWG
jgi:hypothetical protein